MENGKKGDSLGRQEGNKYRRKKEGKIIIRMSEKVIRNHAIIYLKISIIYTNQYKNIHL